jgi:hypothetical protein
MNECRTFSVFHPIYLQTQRVCQGLVTSSVLQVLLSSNAMSLCSVQRARSCLDTVLCYLRSLWLIHPMSWCILYPVSPHVTLCFTYISMQLSLCRWRWTFTIMWFGQLFARRIGVYLYWNFDLDKNPELVSNSHEVLQEPARDRHF